MPTIATVTKRLKKIAEATALEYNDVKESLRKEFIKDSYIEGGKAFCERVRKYGRTEKGSPFG
jgi:hypothetical protein